MKINHTSRWLIIVIVTIISISFNFMLHAQTPQLLNYQGKLTNKDGTPASGTYTIIFSIYAAAADGAALWDETRDVSVTNGVFNVLLGSIKSFPENLFTGTGNRYLGIKIGTDPEMQPRFQLTSVAYAIHASSASMLSASDGDPIDAVVLDEDGNVGIGRKPNARLDVDGKILARVRETGGIGFSALNTQGKRVVDIGNHHSDNGIVRIFQSNGSTETVRLTGSPGENIWLNSGGNIGIGTNTPVSKLHVKGNSWTNLAIETSTDDPSLQLTSDGSSINRDWSIRMDVSDNKKLQFRYDNVQKLTVDANGKVGLGITAPLKPLHIDAKGNSNAIIIVNSRSSNANAESLLPQLPVRSLIIGGIYMNRLFFYWKDENGQTYKLELSGSRWP